VRIAYDEKVSLSPHDWISLSKPRQVFNLCYEMWRDQLLSVWPFTENDYIAVHDADWVKAVMKGELTNGFGNSDPEVLTQVSYAHGAMYAAMKGAIKHGCAFAPVSGFHHAGYDYNGGFCTFNGLLTGIARLRRRHDVRGTILILDFDGHWGDGTNDILQRQLAYLDNVVHLGRNHPFKDPEFATYFAIATIESYKPALVILQAGADSIIGDPFHAGYYTLESWLARDKAIFEVCHRLHVPIVWNLAGGYDGAKTIVAHRETFLNAVEVFDGISRTRARQLSETTLSDFLGLDPSLPPGSSQSSAKCGG
jgi:acetoin utilization deacetylase AcuC-like enzyme